MATHTQKLSGQEIDNILDEIEEKESKEGRAYHENYISKGIIENLDWKPIIQQLRVKNITFIKDLISSKEIHINSIDPISGKTLLIFAVIIGDLDLCKAICHFGCDVKIKDKDNLDAFDYAMKYGRYKITELIYYRQLSGSLGNELQNISVSIQGKNQEAQFIYEYKKPRANDGVSKEYWQEMIECTTTAVQMRAPFTANMLYYSWYFVLKKSESEQLNPFEHPLWVTMMKVYQSIICNTSDKLGWLWLKERFITSLIWYLPHPNKTEVDSGQTLFSELLIRVRAESQRQSESLLKAKIDKIMVEKASEWNELKMFTKQSQNTRQDVCGCLEPRYRENDLNEQRYPPSRHFSAKKHYDTNVYLNELIFTANKVDSTFQNDMKHITKDINDSVGTRVRYRAGPVKTLARSQVKVEKDYIKAAYPKSAQILDINRCALQFNTVHEMLNFIHVLSNRIKDGKAGCVKQVLQCQNGWSIYNPNSPQYTDIKFNVLVEANEGKIVAELQFLLNLMSEFKKKAHELYSVERKFAVVSQFALLTKKMSRFLDFDDINIVFKDLVLADDVKYFADLWENIEVNISNLVAFKICIHIIMSQSGQIHQYLSKRYREMYRESILFYINCVVRLWFLVLESVKMCGYAPLLFVQKLIRLFDDNRTIKSLTEGTEVLRGYGIIFDLLTHNIYAYIDEDAKTITAPVFSAGNSNDCVLGYHKSTEFNIVSCSFTGGTLYACGDGDYGQLGIKECMEMRCKTPTILDEFGTDNLWKIDSYHNHHIAIDADHKAYAWGDNSWGQLGDTKKLFAKANRKVPILLKSLSKYEVISVAVGDAHSLLLTNDGCVWSFGDNRKGQLGIGMIAKKESEKYPTPKIIKKLADSGEYIINISAGSQHSAVVSKQGKLFCFGQNSAGECGANFELGKLMVSPYEVDLNIAYTDSNAFNPYSALESVCAWKYTLVLTTNGTVFRFGHAFVGEAKQWKPTVIGALANQRITHVSAAPVHSLFVTESGELYSHGSGESGVLGHGNCAPQPTPKRVEYFAANNIEIVSCNAGCRSSGAISAEGELFMFGRNEDKELGYDFVEAKSQTGDYNSVPKKVDFFARFKVSKVSSGEGHSHFVAQQRRAKEEQKSNASDDHYLQANKPMRLWCPSFKMLIKNEKLFGKNEWLLLAHKK